MDFFLVGEISVELVYEGVEGGYRFGIEGWRGSGGGCEGGKGGDWLIYRV